MQIVRANDLLGVGFAAHGGLIRLVILRAQTPTVELTVLRRNTLVWSHGPEFDPAAANRLYIRC